MKRLLVILIVLLVSVWLGAVIATDPGYVLIVYRQWTVEAPLWITAMLLFVVFGILYGVLRLWRNIKRLPHRLRARSLLRRTRNAQRLTKQGLLLFAAGKINSAEKKLSQGAAYNSMPWLNYLANAYIAHLQKDLVKQAEYLQQAHEAASDEAQIATGIAQTYFYLQQQQWEQALVLLKQLRMLAPHQPLVLQFLVQVYLQKKDWENLTQLLLDLRKQKIFTAEKIVELEVESYQALFMQSAQENNQAKLVQTWNRMPHALQTEPAIINIYVKALLVIHQDMEAERLLHKILPKVWDKNLIIAYGLINSGKPEAQLNAAEKWLKVNSNDATLLLTLGRLCIKNQLWGKAKSYFEASLALEPQPETYQALGKLFDQLGEPAAAKDCYIRGLGLAISSH